MPGPVGSSRSTRGERENVKWKEREAGEVAEGEVPSNIMRMSLERNVEREYDEQELKRVARMVTSYVATHSASGEECPYRVEVSTMKGMKGIRTDSQALSISVFTNMMEAEKRIFHGILCGVETAQLQLRSDNLIGTFKFREIIATVQHLSNKFNS